jgi:hypothetical protein
VQSGLFREVPAFTALEARIAALSTKQERGDAFEGSVKLTNNEKMEACS